MLRRDRLGRTLIVSLAMTGLPACVPPSTPAPGPHEVIRLTTGAPGGGFHPLGEGLARAYARSLPDITIETRPSEGAVANVEAIQRGDADLGFTFADVAYIAFGGSLKGTSGPYDRVRGIAVLQLTPVHLVMRANAGITEIRDLRGRHVGVGPPRSGTALTAELILQAFGIGPTTVHMELLPFNDAAARLVKGTLDAMFDDAIYPTEAVQAATRAGARLMSVAGPPIERLRHEYPFFRLAVIPRGAYPGVAQAVHTIGVDSLLVCRRDLPEALVYDLTRGFFEALPLLASSHDALKFMDLDQAPATPIPLHEGAARYYRERELTR